MENYYVIVANDDNTVYKVEGFNGKRAAKDFAIRWCDSAFVVVLVNGDAMKYSDNAVIKRARAKIGLKN